MPRKTNSNAKQAETTKTQAFDTKNYEKNNLKININKCKKSKIINKIK